MQDTCDSQVRNTRGFLFGEMIGFYGFYPFLQNVIKQVVCWRGHLTRVVGLEHVQSSGVIVSASTDCSVR